MRHAPAVLVIALLCTAGAVRVSAEPLPAGFTTLAPNAAAHRDPWAVDWLGDHPLDLSKPDSTPGDTSALAAAFAGRFNLDPGDQGTARRAVPVEYSEGYKVRAKIHKIASFATIPLFVAEYVVGQDLYNNPGSSESKRGAHGALAGSIGVLFGVNSVTGVWNLWEARKDPNHRTLRTVHGILMLVADAGFVATGALAPGEQEDGGAYLDTGRRSTHRTVALTSMGIATFSYLLMLFGGR